MTTSSTIETKDPIERAIHVAVTEAIRSMGLERFKQCSFFLSSDYHKPGGRGHEIARRLERRRRNKATADVAQG